VIHRELQNVALDPVIALNLEGNLAENFKEWIQSFELYLTATGIEEKAEKVQVATFLHVAGPDAQRVYNTFDIVALPVEAWPYILRSEYYKQYDRELNHLINVQTHMV
jgi:hypothetical protein